MENTTNTVVQGTMENAAEAVQQVLPEAGKTIGLKEFGIGAAIVAAAALIVIHIRKEKKAKKVEPVEVQEAETKEPETETTEEVKPENLN